VALPKWVEEQRVPDASNEQLLFRLPDVTPADWERAAKSYRTDATRVALFLRALGSPLEQALDEAERDIRAGHETNAKALLRELLERGIRSEDPPRLWTRAALTASLLSDREFEGKFVDVVNSRLREEGLDSVAAMIEKFGDINEGFGSDVAETFKLGLLSVVDNLYVSQALSERDQHPSGERTAVFGIEA
jgi:hypothetical protein